MAYTYIAAITLPQSQTGLSLRAALRDASGTIHASLRDISTGFIENGQGFYYWRSAAIPDSYEGVAVFYTGTLGAASNFSGVTLRSQSPVSPREVENTDTKVSAVLTTALTESYAVDGAAFTAAQALYMLWSALSEFSISGTTITCKRLDGSTTSLTFTLDSASSPTSRTRAS